MISCCRTTTAPSPLNLITTWLMYFVKLVQKSTAKKDQRPSLVGLMGLRTGERMSPRSRMGAKWLSKVKKGQVHPRDNARLSVVHLSPLGSQLSFNTATRIESVVDWDMIRKKYIALTSNEPEKEAEGEEKKEGAGEPEEDNGPTASNASTVPAAAATPPI